MHPTQYLVFDEGVKESSLLFLFYFLFFCLFVFFVSLQKHFWRPFPASIYLFKVNNENTRTMREICLC